MQIMDVQNPLVIDLTGDGNPQELITAPGAGYAIWVTALALTPNIDCTVQFQDGASSPVELGLWRFGKGIVVPASPIMHDVWMKCTEAKPLKVIITNGVLLDGIIKYLLAKV